MEDGQDGEQAFPTSRKRGRRHIEVVSDEDEGDLDDVSMDGGVIQESAGKRLKDNVSQDSSDAQMERKPDADDKDEGIDDVKFDGEEESAASGDEVQEGSVQEGDSGDVKGGSEDEDDEESSDEDEVEEKAMESRFVDIAAQDDENANEEDENEMADEIKEILDDKEVDDKEGETMRNEYRSFQQQIEAAGDEQEQARMLEERYRDYGAIDEERIELGPADQTETAMSANLPTAKDPSLFIVRCRKGEEYQLVAQLLQKCINFSLSGQRLPDISAAVCRRPKSGFILVEAYNESGVKNAIKGFTGIFQYTKAKKVPLRNMVDFVSPPPIKQEFKAGVFARIKVGLYRKDLCEVLNANYAAGMCQVKVVPRLKTREFLAEEGEQSGRPKRGQRRPPAKLLFEHQDHLGYYRQFDFDKKGFMIREQRMASLTVEKNPSFEEFSVFRPAIENENTNEADEDVKDSMPPPPPFPDVATAEVFEVGDVVRVLDGELKDLVCKVQSISESKLTVVPDESVEILRGMTLDFDPKEVEKYFQNGDHVIITGGTYKSDTGFVIQVARNVIEILSDSQRRPIKVGRKDLRLSAEVSTGSVRFGKYELFDLIEFGRPGKVGCIIRIGPTHAVVLDVNNIQHEVPHGRIARKLNSRVASAVDARQNAINVKDRVKVASHGLYEGIEGNTMRIFRSTLFVQTREIHENSGIFAVHSTSVFVPRSGPTSDLSSGMNDVALTPQGPESMRSPSIRTPSATGSGRKPGLRPGMDDQLIGREVVMTRSQYKGYRGIVRQATDAYARVELMAKARIVTVPKTYIKDVEGDGDFEAQSATYSVNFPSGEAGPGLAGPHVSASAGSAVGWGGGEMPDTPFASNGPTPRVTQSEEYNPYNTPITFDGAGGTPREFDAPYSPHDGGPSPFRPSTPTSPYLPRAPEAAEADGGPDRSAWLRSGVAVRVISGPYDGELGKIVSLRDGEVSVAIDDGVTVSLEPAMLSAVRASAKLDRVLVLAKGRNFGNTGVVQVADEDNLSILIDNSSDIVDCLISQTALLRS